MLIGNKLFEFDKCGYIMGILNSTPDSFSDGGNYLNLSQALLQTEKMIFDGADIIDIGGESTRPGHVKISEQEEIERVIPLVEKIRDNFEIIISVDTYKSQVAKEAIKAGASLINDIWGLKYDNSMANVIKEYDVCCCLMHNRNNTVYNNFLEDVLVDLSQSLIIAQNEGIDRNKIMIDPGIGFAKDLKQNIELLNNLELLQKFELPLLLGTSRKSVIGLTLDLPVNERIEGTIATNIIGFMKGCRIFRVHDVKENFRAIKMAEAIIY